MSDLLSSLNPSQQEAVRHFEGPALVIAGAGSGKTKTVVHRIAYLLRERGVYPGEILAVTFTNKAAGEMKERLHQMVGGASKDLWVSTFHSSALRILRVYGEFVGLRSGFVVYDDDDQGSLLKEILKELEVEAKPGPFRAMLDRIKNKGGGLSAYLKDAPDFIGGVPQDVAAEIYRRYQASMKAQGAVDFNDLLLLTIDLFENNEGVLRKVQQRARFVHVDEYQDTNPVQYKITKLLAGEKPNLMVVGDPDQCLPPGTLVCTPTGAKPIETLEAGDWVCGTGGKYNLLPGKVTQVKQGRYTGPLWQVEAGGGVLTGTPHHLVPVRMPLDPGRFFIYLMYRADRGYRVGQTKTVRSNDEGKLELGFRIRLNQEHGDKLWLLKVCDTYAEARYYEAFYAAHYGLPTQLFHGLGRNLAMDDAWIERLFENLDTHASARRLMADLHLHPEFPHYRPQNGLVRQTLNFTQFGNRAERAVGHHRVQWSSVRPDLIGGLEAAGFSVRQGKSKSQRFETARKDYREALGLAKAVAQAGGVEIRRRMQVGSRVYELMPLSHLHPGMVVLAQGAEGLEEAPVTQVSQTPYDGPVYDLEVDVLHNYVANRLVVHNSIYSFRNADINNILDFSKDYPGARVIRLEQNYRSTANILQIANAVIEQNTQRLDKTLRAVKDGGEPVRLYRAPNAREEAAFVAREIARRGNFKNIAILYRTNAQSRLFEEHLRRANVPIKLVGAVGFFERREIKDLLAYGRVAVNPLDAIGLRRIVNTPTRGIGASTVAKLVEHAQKMGISVMEAFRQAEHVVSRPQQMQGFIALMDSLSEAAYETGPVSFFERVMDETGFRDFLKLEPDGEDRIQNVEELLQAARDWETEEGGTLADFLDSVALTAKAEEPQDVPEESVTAMTLHNAKGLEFPTVFLVGLEENLLPHRNSQNRLEEFEEERRLFYVGITRAQETLYLTYAEERETYGKREFTRPSRFLEDIPLELLKEVSAFGDANVPVVNYARPSEPKPRTILAEFRGGERVRHPKFGEGTVVAALGGEVTVMFPGTGLKKLAVKFAGLERL